MKLLLFNLKTDADDDILGFTTDWINELAGHFDKIIVLTMYAGRILVKDNVEVYSAGKEKGYSEARRAIEFYRLLIRILKSERIDACFAHMMPLFAIMGKPLLWLKKIPVVMWFAHGHVSRRLRLAEKAVKIIFTPTRNSCRLKSNKIKVVGHGIKAGDIVFRVRNLNKKNLKVLYVGRITPVKSIDKLLEAVEMSSREYDKEVWLTVVGSTITDSDRQYFEILQLRVNELGLTGRVNWVGKVAHGDIWKYYDRNDVFVNPSNTGSMDKTVLEAMAVGMPVITGNEAFDTPEFKAAGYFTNNEASGLYKALAEILQQDEDELKERLIKGRRWVEENHSIEKLAGIIAQQIKAIVLNRQL